MTYVMTNMLPLALYVFAFGLAGHGWLSEVLPLRTKVILTLIAVALILVGIGIQWLWPSKSRSNSTLTK